MRMALMARRVGQQVAPSTTLVMATVPLATAPAEVPTRLPLAMVRTLTPSGSNSPARRTW